MVSEIIISKKEDVSKITLKYNLNELQSYTIITKSFLLNDIDVFEAIKKENKLILKRDNKLENRFCEFDEYNLIERYIYKPNKGVKFITTYNYEYYDNNIPYLAKFEERYFYTKKGENKYTEDKYGRYEKIINNMTIEEKNQNSIESCLDNINIDILKIINTGGNFLHFYEYTEWMNKRGNYMKSKTNEFIYDDKGNIVQINKKYYGDIEGYRSVVKIKYVEE